MKQKSNPDYEIIDIIKQHWSPRAFSEKKVEKASLQKIFEAARWSSSCFNEQPWRFLVGIKDEGVAYNKLFSCLVEGNQKWLGETPVLVLACAKKTFTLNGNQNNWSEYDLGQAVGFLTLQAHNEGLYTHQMAGFDKDKVKAEFNLDSDFEPVCVICIGYLGDPENLDEKLKQAELSDSKRKKQTEFTFNENWGSGL
ncbi:MAG: nitroreductase family protein [Candidatus Sericytochromatia bacterium]